MKIQNIKLLAVDDNTNTLEVIQRILQNAGYDVKTCQSAVEAVSALSRVPIDLVITDYKMPKYSGMELIQYIHENHRDAAVIMVTGYATIDGAVEAVKKGAEAYLAKPFTEQELLTAVGQALEKLERRRSIQTSREPTTSHGIVGNSTGMQQVFKMIAKAAALSANVLISGESGTGKELVARAIHYEGPRSAAPFVPVNCTAIPDSLLESELFGHVKGAFTGANVSREGFFQVAHNGTIFLDEIGDASLNLQGKLLRTIQSKEIFMVGSSQVRKVDTRIIAATHKDLPSLVQKKLFREDLYYRLNIIDIPIPPLRERKEDVPALVNHFVSHFCRDMDRKQPAFSDSALDALMNYGWPGNIRELENLLQRLLVIIDDDRIDVGDLPEVMRYNINTSQAGIRSLSEVEAEHILNVLAGVEGNKTKAAQNLRHRPQNIA